MNKRAVIGLVLVISFLFVLYPGAVTFAEGNTHFSVDVADAALQLTIPQTASIELSPTTSSAVFGSTNVTINVATNNMNGYILSMSVPTTDLTHNTIANTVIPTLSAQAPESSFPANAWGYKVVDNDFLPVLTTNIPDSWIVDGPTNGTDHIMTLAAKIDGTKTSGIYTNTLIFNAVAIPNTLRDTVVFNGNGADSGSMANQQIYQGEPTKLTANAYTKTGYLFNGWNTKSNATGVGYGDENNYTSVISAAAKTITLYAQWICDSSINTCEGVPSADGSVGYRGKTLQDAYEMAYVTNSGAFQEGNNNKHRLYVPEKDPVTGLYTGSYYEATRQSDYEGIPANDLRFAIQDIDMEIDGVKVCDYATVVGSEAYVLDLRDFKSYHIAKFLDGHCWMQENLRLGDESSSILLTAADTNIVSDFTLPASSSITFSTYTSPLINTSSIDSLNKGYKAGVYYNYCAVSGGTYCYGERNGVDLPDTDIDSPYDVCPKGWRLPKSTASSYLDNEVKSLNLLYDSSESFDNIFHFTLAGAWHRKVDNFGSRAYYWTSTYTLPQSMAFIQLGSNNVVTGSTYNRYFGFSVRCVAK